VFWYLPDDDVTSDCCVPCSAETEADTFWCFTNLMSEIRDNFSKHLDHDHVFGTGRSLARSFVCLQHLANHLASFVRYVSNKKGSPSLSGTVEAHADLRFTRLTGDTSGKSRSGLPLLASWPAITILASERHCRWPLPIRTVW